MPLNSICLQGNIAGEIKESPYGEGKRFATFSLAVQDTLKDKSGNYECDFINITVWSPQSEYVLQHGSKGRGVVLQGKLKNRAWTDKEGNKRYSSSVHVSHISFTTQSPGGNTPIQTERPKPKKAVPQEDEDFDESDPFANE